MNKKFSFVEAIAIFFFINAFIFTLSYLKEFIGNGVSIQIILYSIVRVFLLVLSGYGLWKKKRWGPVCGVLAGIDSSIAYVRALSIYTYTTVAKIIDITYLCLFIIATVYLIIYWITTIKYTITYCDHCFSKVRRGDTECPNCGSHLSGSNNDES